MDSPMTLQLSTGAATPRILCHVIKERIMSFATLKSEKMNERCS